MKKTIKEHVAESCETCTYHKHAVAEGVNETFSRIYEEIRENYQKNSVLTGHELLEFIQHIELQMLREAEDDDN